MRLSIWSWARAAVASLALLAAMAGGAVAASPNANGQSVVRAVLFYSPSCPHCHVVMSEDLPPLQQAYGDRLQIAVVDITSDAGGAIYDAAVVKYKISDDRLGVPCLVAGDIVLVGSAEIPEQFPALVRDLLARGGSDWPDIPGLAELVSAWGPTFTLPPNSSADPGASSAQDSVLSEAFDRASRDPLGSSLAVVVLLALLVAIAWASSTAWRAGTAVVRAPSAWIPVLSLAGLAVAAYLAAIELTASSAVCGPVGDCNLVHESEYAKLFGLLPIGVLGVAGYAAIMAAWVTGRLAGGRLSQVAHLGLFAMALLGAAFSAYLTFLEPFVIGATCGWCVASAVLMGVLLVVATASMWPPRPRPVARSRRR